MTEWTGQLGEPRTMQLQSEREGIGVCHREAPRSCIGNLNVPMSDNCAVSQYMWPATYYLFGLGQSDSKALNMINLKLRRKRHRRQGV